MPTPSIETCFAQLLRDSAEILDLVSGRVHIANRPQGDSLPSIVIRLQEYGDQPNIGTDETQIEPRVAVDCYAASYNDAYLLDQAVRAIQSHTGEVECIGADNTVYGSRVIDAIVAEDTTTDENAPADASDIRVYSRSTLFFVLAYK